MTLRAWPMKYYITFPRAILISCAILLTACGFEEDDSSSSSGSNEITQLSISSESITSDTPVETDQANDSADELPETTTGTVFAKPNVYSANQAGNSIEVFWDPVNASEFRVIVWPENDVPRIYVTTDFEFSTEITTSGEHIIFVEAYDELGNSLFSDPSTLEVL